MLTSFLWAQQAIAASARAQVMELKQQPAVAMHAPMQQRPERLVSTSPHHGHIHPLPSLASTTAHTF